jgi:hypothetical protein
MKTKDNTAPPVNPAGRKTLTTLRDIRRAGVPLAAIETADPAETMRSAVAALNGKEKETPLACWDISGGLAGMNNKGVNAVSWYDPLAMPLPEMLKGFRENAERFAGGILFLLNVQRYFDRDGVAQALWNLRDTFKRAKVRATCVLVGPPLTGANKLPPELSSDVVVITEPAPDREAVEAVVNGILRAAAASGADVEKVDRPAVVSALLGLQSAFDVEQTLSLSVRKDGVDVAGCWERKIARLRAQTGAEISINNPGFDALAGCANVKDELRAFINGRQRPGVVLFIDEIEKLFAGAGTDLSGVSTNLVGMFLTWTAERRAKGFLLPGVPGAGKTWTAHCAAGEAGIPLFKLSDIKASLVGESEAKLRAALSAVDALAGDGSVLMIASCNWVDSLSPDIMARFTMGQFFYDFPDEDERLALWRMYTAKHALPDEPKDMVAVSEGWVGREIEACCWRAWQFDRPLADVAKNICPSAVSQKAKLDALRKSCSGRFLSASQPGLYQFQERTAKVETAGRALSFE